MLNHFSHYYGDGHLPFSWGHLLLELGISSGRMLYPPISRLASHPSSTVLGIAPRQSHQDQPPAITPEAESQTVQMPTMVFPYWVVQVGLLTPLTFAQHCLSRLAAFTSGAYFLHNGRRWQSICKFYTANLGIFGGLWSECVWQQEITCCSCYRMPQNAFFPQTCDLLVSQQNWCKDTFFPHSIPFPW